VGSIKVGKDADIVLWDDNHCPSMLKLRKQSSRALCIMISKDLDKKEQELLMKEIS
jgi:cytosine/adenosine deaminase-related metal-dependent hydrolase